MTPAAVAVLCTAGCSDPPTAPPPPTLTITCPTTQRQPSTDGVGAAVSYPAPLTAGGKAPVTVLCKPAPGSVFPIGSNPVTCTATDSASPSQTAQCAFQVDVTAPPRISATSFVAFGDSMSDGVLGLTTLSTGPGDPGPVVGYAFKLRGLLRDRYTAQTIVMTDEGCPGETVSTATANCAGGIYRLPTVLSRDRPQALLLLEGINDLNGGGAAAIQTVISGLRTMVRQGRGSGIPVFLATLLPEGYGIRASDAARAAIPPANSQIRTLASAEGAILVDLYVAFDGQTSTLIGPDGLHPNDAGYTKMAETFFDVIKSKLETTPTTFGFVFPMHR